MNGEQSKPSPDTPIGELSFRYTGDLHCERCGEMLQSDEPLELTATGLIHQDCDLARMRRANPHMEDIMYFERVFGRLARLDALTPDEWAELWNNVVAPILCHAGGRERGKVFTIDNVRVEIEDRPRDYTRRKWTVAPLDQDMV